MDWAAVACVLSPVYASDEGRPSYPVLTVVKLLLLQQWYGLSILVWRRRWTTGFGFGYKAHIAVDQSSDLIRDAILTGADLHDSMAGAFCAGRRGGDLRRQGLDSERFRDALAEAGIKAGIMNKDRRNHPLKHWQKWLNKVVSPIRCSVERSFATMKRHYRYRRVHYLGLARNRCHLNLMCAAINLRHAIALAA